MYNENVLINYNAYVLIEGTTAIHYYIINICISKVFLIIHLNVVFIDLDRIPWDSVQIVQPIAHHDARGRRFQELSRLVVDGLESSADVVDGLLVFVQMTLLVDVLLQYILDCLLLLFKDG